MPYDKVQENFKSLADRDFVLAIDLLLTRAMVREANVSLYNMAKLCDRKYNWLRRVLDADRTMTDAALTQGMLRVDKALDLYHQRLSLLPQ